MTAKVGGMTVPAGWCRMTGSDPAVRELAGRTPQEMERAYLEYRRAAYQQLVAHASGHGLLAALRRPASVRQLATRIGCRPEHQGVLSLLLRALVRAGAVDDTGGGWYQCRAGAGAPGPPPRRELLALALGAGRVAEFLTRDAHQGIIPRLREPAGEWASDFDHDAPGWAAAFGRPYYRYSRLRAAQAVARPGGRVLDLGCGPGTGLVELVGRVGPPGLVVGLELSFPQLAHGARLTSAVPGVGLVQADLGTGLPLADDQFDGATAVGVLHFVHHPDRVLADLARVLRPRARLCVAHTYTRRGSLDQELVDLGMAGVRPPGTALRPEAIVAAAGRHGLHMLAPRFSIGCFAWLLFERGGLGSGGPSRTTQGGAG